jgi:dimethylaniline monooxygenase (N-oxide forming)
MQSRYFALLCSGKRTLPEKNELRRLIAQDREAEEQAFYARRSQGTLCSYTPYMDALAELVGCRPRVRDFLFNPRMAYHLLCGANIPTAYRLRGPHAAPEMAQRVMLRLPIAYSSRELVTLSYLHILNRLGMLAEPEEAKVYEKAPV